MKRHFEKPFWLLMFTSLFLTLTSCIGMSADIQIKRDGSGKITMEYRFSKMAETLGRLDGNERWQIIPTGRADMERTAARVPGIKIVSFSSKEEAKDIVNRVTFEFENTDALLKFIDSSGRHSKLSRTGNSNRLDIILNAPLSSQINEGLAELMRQVSDGYKFKLSFNAPGNSTIAFTDFEGNAITLPAGAKVVSSGKKVSLEIETQEILTFTDGLGVSISW